jgi:hypothetical protein
MLLTSQSFHNYLDQNVRPYQVYTTGGIWRPTQTVVSRTRSVSYQFFPFFHPYVGRDRAFVPGVMLSLIERLRDGGVTELEESDTLYMPQPNPPATAQPLQVLPKSTRATLTANVTGTRPGDGTAIPLTAGTPLNLPDGTTISVAAGTVVSYLDGSIGTLSSALSFALPGQIPYSGSSGIQLSGSSTIIPDYTLVTLPNGATLAVLTNDGSSVNLPTNTTVSLRSGLPLPFFYEGIFSTSEYNPYPDNVQQPYPVKNLDFTTQGPYAIYNWEIFFHAPLLIAIHLSQNQQYEDAQNWFHYIFNPTDNGPGPTPERFWKVQPFQSNDVEMIQDILVNLSQNPPQDPQLFKQTVASINAWMQNPFQPWVVAQYRPTAYMLKTVMAYLDNLIAWGDSLFLQYTIETINEATQIYILAANILGDKPQPVPVKRTVQPLTFNQLRASGLDAFGNTMVEMEVDIPFDLVAPSGTGTPPNGSQILPSAGNTLYFCVPQNDQLLAYWDTVADRLFKIHNSLNIQGVFQQLPLYDPPIDPALLVRAAASGLDVSAIVSGLDQPLPLVRFQLLVAKAAEICQEVKSLGANLLAAIEKQDNESLALLRAQHENTILGLAEMVKYAQWQDAQKATQALQLNLAGAVQRYSYYQTLLGVGASQIQSSIPQLSPLDLGSLQNLNFSQTDASNEPLMTAAAVTPNIAQNPTIPSDGAIVTLIQNEVDELNHMNDAQNSTSNAQTSEGIAAALGFIPDFAINTEPIGVGMSTTLGGTYAAKFPQAAALGFRDDAESSTYQANLSGKIGGYARRELDWLNQSNSAISDINAIIKQIRGAQIREAIAQREYTNHQNEMQNAQQIVDFLSGNQIGGNIPVKETTIGFYTWMKREVKALYANAFQLAFEVAKKAERAMQNELGNPSLSYIGYNYLDGIEGLLAGEKLLFDVKTMEMAYHDLNQREYELTKHVSLLQVAPLALIQLRATGSCFFTLPEELFDLDGPGHYFRRTKAMAVSLPSVAGPFTSVNCTLTLQKSTIRTTPALGTGYARQGADDSRFQDYYGTVQSIVTSSGQNDSGLFENNLHDERYLPFEATGIAGSQWQLSLPADIRQFDFTTITDAILHVRYTAREGGDILKAAAVANLQSLIANARTVGSVCLFSIRHEFPSQWAKFQSVAIGSTTPTAELQLTLIAELYPFWAQGILVGTNPVRAVEFFAQMDPANSATRVNINDKPDLSGKADTLVPDPLQNNLFTGTLTNIALPTAITDTTHPPLTLYFDNNTMDDLWMAITWGK